MGGLLADTGAAATSHAQRNDGLHDEHATVQAADTKATTMVRTLLLHALKGQRLEVQHPHAAGWEMAAAHGGTAAQQACARGSWMAGCACACQTKATSFAGASTNS